MKSLRSQDTKAHGKIRMLRRGPPVWFSHGAFQLSDNCPLREKKVLADNAMEAVLCFPERSNLIDCLASAGSGESVLPLR